MMGRRILHISGNFFTLFFSGGEKHYRVIRDAIPGDARIVNVRLGWPDVLEILLESPEWEDNREGDVYPPIEPRIETLYSKEDMVTFAESIKG